ncbi:armadillo-type protein [Mycena capillaripes]|nr:armadillo-type protein [Mycena capillaripes]
MLVLAELPVRAKIEENASALVDFLTAEQALFDELSQSPTVKFKAFTCALPCARLARMLRDPDFYARDAALFALIKISTSPQGVQAVMKAQSLESAADSLISRITDETSTELGERDSDVAVCRSATTALAEISRWPEGAHAVIDAKILTRLEKLLYSPDPVTRACACLVVRRLKMEKRIVDAVLAIHPSERLVTLVNDPYEEHLPALLAVLTSKPCAQFLILVRCAVYALAKLSIRSEGAEAVVEVNALHDAAAHLSSLVPEIRKLTCELLDHVAQHEETLPWSATRWTHTDIDTSSATQTLRSADAPLPLWPDGAAAVGSAQAVNAAMPLMELPDEQVKQWVSTMLGNLVRHEQASSTYMTTGIGELVSSLKIHSSGQVIGQHIRLRNPPDSALGPEIPEALQALGQLLGSTPDQKLASNMMEGLTSFLLASMLKQDIGRYIVVIQ